MCTTVLLNSSVFASLKDPPLAQDLKSLDDKRLGRLFGPAYEEPNPADEKENIVIESAPPPRSIFTYLDK